MVFLRCYVKAGPLIFDALHKSGAKTKNLIKEALKTKHGCSETFLSKNEEKVKNH